MSVIKIKKRKERFAVISTNILENPELSYKAKGMLCYLLSKPEDWTIRTKDLENRSKDGRDSVRSGLRELRSAGYAEIVQERNEKGQLLGKSYIIHEIPKTPTNGKTDERENLLSGNPKIGEPVDIVSNIPNNKDLPTNKQKGLFQEQPSIPLFEFFKDLPKSFNALTLEATGQPSKKTLKSWQQKFGEEFVLEEIFAFERWLQRKKKEKKLPQIKSLSKRLSKWLNNKYIDNDEERQLFQVWKENWKQTVASPFRFDFFKSSKGKSSDDRKALSSIAEYYAKQPEKNAQQEWNRVLRNLPEFWKAQRLSIIAKNLPKITRDIDKAQQGGGKSAGKNNCASISSLDFI